jgi:hypothetical protein
MRNDRRHFVNAICKKTTTDCPNCEEDVLWECPRGFICVKCGYESNLVKMGAK